MPMTEPRAGTRQDLSVDSPPIAPPKPVRLVICSAFGVQITLRITVDLLRYLPSPLIPVSLHTLPTPAQHAVFQFIETRSASGRPLFIVIEDGAVVLASGDVALAARALESRVHLQVAALTSQAVFVHAGVVRWRNQALLFPGPSYSGKSTLVAALIAAGATYYSDEYAVISLDGYVHAFPRPLRLRPDLAHDRALCSFPCSDVSDSLPPLPLGQVFNLRYAPAAVWEPRPLTPGQTLLALLENTVAVRRQSELTLSTLRLAIAPAAGWQSERGDAAAAALEILQLIDQTDDMEAASIVSAVEKGSYDQPNLAS
jgi:hypothetical protein